MDDPNITMEEYIRLEEEKAQRHGRTFNWKTATYENDNDKVDMPSPELTVSYFDDLDHFKDFENEFPAIVYNDGLTSNLDFLTKPTVSPQHIDEFNLKNDTSLSKHDEEEQNIMYFNDLFPLNIIYPDDLKSDKDNDNDEIQSSRGNTDDELTEKKLKQIKADDQAIQTILLSLPEDIYATVDSCETAQKIWLRVQQMMKGSNIGIQEKKAKLFNEWEMFTSTDKESIESYYHRFLKLMNDLKRNKHFPKKLPAISSFLNNLQPEWSRHVTIVHQTKDLHTTDYTQLYDFMKYNQNDNYMQQPMPNPEDITDPTTAMNMALALMAKAFKLNYSTPTNNNQRISLNPRYRQIAQPGMNMGQDRQMNRVIQNVVQNPRIQNVENQNGQIVVSGNANQNPNGNGNLVAARTEGNATGHNADLDEIEEVNANCILMANLQQASTSGTHTNKAPIYDSDGSAEVHNYENCYDNEIFNMFTQEEQYTELLEPIPEPHQVPQNDNNIISEVSSVEESGGTVEQHPANVEETCVLYDSLYNNLATEVEIVNTINRKLSEIIAELTTELARYKNQEKYFEISQEKYDKLERCYQKYVYQEQCLSKKINALHLSFDKQIMTLNEKTLDLNKHLSMEKSTVYSLLEEKKKLKSDFKIRKDELLDKQIQLEKKIKEIDNILDKTESAKFVGDFKSLAKEADESLAKHKALELEIERLLRAVVSQDIMYVVQNNSVNETSNLQTELERTKERFENCIIKKVNEYAKLWNDWYKKCEECKFDKISYDKAYNDMHQKIERLLAQLGDLKGKSKDTSCVLDTLNPLSQKLENENVELEFQVSDQKDTACGTSANTKFAKQSILGKPPKVGETHALSKPITSNSIRTPQGAKVMKNVKVIASGMFRINPFKPSREEKYVPNKVRASVRTNPITVSQPPVITKKVVNSDSNGLSSTGIDNTKTRRPQPRSNTKNDRVPSASKSSRSKNKEVEVEEHHRKLLLSRNKKHMSSECNNVKLATQNVKSKVVCAICKKCLNSVNHDVCLLNYVNGMTSRGKKQTTNVSINEKQKKQQPKVMKTKKVGSIERLASPKPSKPRSFLRWSPTGRLFDLKGKIIASSESKSQSDCSNGDNACTSNPLEPTIKRFPNSIFSLFLGTVRFGNDHVAAILGFGDLQWGNILITRVYFIKGLGHNLLSIGQFCNSDLEVAFRRNTCFIRNLEGVDLLKGIRTINLYTINLHEMASASPICLMARATSTKSWLWHQRLSHLNFDTINDLAKNDLVFGLPKFKYHKEHLCPSCEQGKSKRASHPPKLVSNSRQMLHLLHMDLCGPMRIACINGKRTPQQNRVVKRRNRTLVEAARTMLIFSRAPLFLWAKAIATACFTQNCSIIHRRFNKTPYELINGRKPDIFVLHVFGALCYPKNDREDIGKLGAKGDIGFFICYSADSCAYRVFNRRTKKIMETMNVTFDELLAMAFKQRSSKPGLQSMTSGQISSGLDLTYAPSTITSQKPTEGKLDLLFEAMYDDYIGGQPSTAPRTVSTAQAHRH
uniref:Uncharacterized protein n=1 Tax=Tanacetum cinerariifolium TaxID=118510 RepID=A0A6L2K1P0_TANCI|nr:hypothetical protein [Tanacetum cinerariifolium]